MQQTVEFTDDMLKRNERMDSAVYEMCLAFLELEPTVEDLEERFPWDISLLAGIRDFVIFMLRKKNYRVCDPYIDCGEKEQYCSLEECGFEKCTRHPEKEEPEYEDL